MNARIPITTRSIRADGCRVAGVPAHGARVVTHELPVRPGACPVSRNPLRGTLRICYAPAGLVAEVVTLFDAWAWAQSGADAAPKSAEQLAAWIGSEVATAVEVRVRAELDIVVNPGEQRLLVVFLAGPPCRRS